MDGEIDTPHSCARYLAALILRESACMLVPSLTDPEFLYFLMVRMMVAHTAQQQERIFAPIEIASFDDQGHEIISETLRMFG